MKKKYIINFQEVESPIIEPVTKFGDQPVWIESPEWAISKSTGEPLIFICQIRLEEEIFGKIESKMAYVFINNDEDADTFASDSGENAVIIQPNGNNPLSASVVNGEILCIWKEVKGEKYLQSFPCEFDVGKPLIVEDEEKMSNQSNLEENKPEEYSQGKIQKLDKPLTENNLSIKDLKLTSKIEVTNFSFTSSQPDENNQGFENKIGGVPNFLQNEEFPDGDPNNWNLLLQLDSGSVPFSINFGDVGVGYAFLSKDGKTGKFLWQCS